jgi:hypothetical protein
MDSQGIAIGDQTPDSRNRTIVPTKLRHIGGMTEHDEGCQDVPRR